MLWCRKYLMPSKNIPLISLSEKLTQNNYCKNNSHSIKLDN